MSRRRTNANRSQVENDNVNLEDPVKECVRYIVCREGGKIPIKRAEIIKHLNSVCQTETGMVNKVILEASKSLKQIYGYKLIQVDSKSGIQYIVVLDERCASLPSTATDPQQQAILIAALTHIFMTGGPVKEDEMWKFLSEAGLLEETDHAGRKLLTNTFVKQLYLTYTKVGEGDLAKFVFEWGQRAIEELPKMFLLEKMAQAFNKNVDHWYEQFKEAKEQGGEEAEVNN